MSIQWNAGRGVYTAVVSGKMAVVIQHGRDLGRKWEARFGGSSVGLFATMREAKSAIATVVA